MSATNGNGNGDTPARIDLNAARAARREARADTSLPPIAVDEALYPLISEELPLAVLDAIGDVSRGEVARVGDAVRALVGPQAYEELITTHALTLDDLEVLLEGAMTAYGVPFEKRRASESSSPGTSTHSRPTSSASTRPTSGRRSGAKATR